MTTKKLNKSETAELEGLRERFSMGTPREELEVLRQIRTLMSRVERIEGELEATKRAKREASLKHEGFRDAVSLMGRGGFMIGPPIRHPFFDGRY